MENLIKLQCPNCGGHIDRETLTCNSCGLKFEWRGGQLVRMEVSNVPLVYIGEGIAIPGFYIKSHPEEASECALNELASRLAKKLLPLLEYQAHYEPIHNDYVIFARTRVEQPKFDNQKFQEFKDHWWEQL